LHQCFERAGAERADPGSRSQKGRGIEGHLEQVVIGAASCVHSASLAQRPDSLSTVITALAGGVGAARLLRGMVRAMSASDVIAVVNTGDDTVLHGLYISPDLDTVTYTLGGLNDDERGWGLAGETWKVMEALERLGGETWFGLGDQDLATHLYRTQRLASGAPLSQVTAEITSALGVGARLLPMSDDPVRTRLRLAGGPEISFQDYFVRRHHDVAVEAVRFDGAAQSRPAPGVLDALDRADKLVICPSNPVVSIGPILAVPGVLDALSARREDVVAVSPIVAGAALKGPAGRLLVELGHGSSVVGVARLYAQVAATLVIDEADAGLATEVEATGARCVVTPTIMHTPDHAATLARVVLGGAAAPASSTR
jgi:LPPG:FO 2-phospho-L-lactate transferase